MVRYNDDLYLLPGTRAFCDHVFAIKHIELNDKKLTPGLHNRHHQAHMVLRKEFYEASRRGIVVEQLAPPRGALKLVEKMVAQLQEQACMAEEKVDGNKEELGDEIRETIQTLTRKREESYTTNLL
jgi:hypothetical protein